MTRLDTASRSCAVEPAMLGSNPTPLRRWATCRRAPASRPSGHDWASNHASPAVAKPSVAKMRSPSYRRMWLAYTPPYSRSTLATEINSSSGQGRVLPVDCTIGSAYGLARSRSLHLRDLPPRWSIVHRGGAQRGLAPLRQAALI